MANEEHLKILEQGVDVWNKWREENPNITPDLSHINFHDKDLRKINLQKADLSSAIFFNNNLSNANFTDVQAYNSLFDCSNLQKANFKNAALNKASFRHTKAQNSNFDSSHIWESDFQLADLRWANFYSAKAQHTLFDKANLQNTIFRSADLKNSDLSETKLQRADLSNARLECVRFSFGSLDHAIIEHTNLINAIFYDSSLSRTIFSYSNLTSSRITTTNLHKTHFSSCILTGVKIDQKTNFNKVIGCQIGVNGFYSAETNSAALTQMTPKGNSMQGSNPDAVVDSLNHAKKLHFVSLTLVGISLLLLVLHIPTLKLPFGLTGKEVDAINFAALSVIISFGLCSLTAFFFSSALEGAKYINGRESAMQVGHFPWILSKYEHTKWRRRLSIAAKVILCFHPVVYFPFFINFQSLFSGKWTSLFHSTDSLPSFLSYLLPIFAVLLFTSCYWIFKTSLGFLKPILFDPQTEAARKTDTEKITEALDRLNETTKEQTAKMDEILGVLKKGNNGKKTDEEN